MKLFDGMLEKMGLLRKKAVGPLIDDSRLWKSLRQILNQTGVVVQQPYKQSTWVYSSIHTIAMNLCRVPFQLKKDKGPLEPDVVEEGPLYDLFLKPNPLMTLTTLIEATFVYLNLRGEAIWILEGRDNITEIPKEIWCFDPARFDIVKDKKGMQIGWAYKGKDTIPFRMDEVIHFKLFNPYDDFRGLSPLEAARLSVDQDYHASLYNKSFFENGATVGGFITVEGELTEEQYTRLLKQFEDRHKGSAKAHKIMLLEGKGDFKEAKLSQKDMDFIDGRKLTRKEILACFGVNEVVLGIFTDIKSYEGIKAAHKAFWEETLMPLIMLFQETLWANFFSKIGVRRGKGRVWGEFDLANVGPLQANYKEKIDTAMKMFTMGYPINHINRRLQLGMQEVPWGNMWFVPGGYLPVTLLGKDPPASVPAPAGEEETEEEKEPKKILHNPVRRDMQEKMKKLLFEKRKKALDLANNGGDWSHLLMDKEFSKLEEELKALYMTGVYTGYVAIQQQFPGDLFPLDKYAGDIDSFASKRSGAVSKGFRHVLRGLIEVVEKKTLSSDTLSEKVRETFVLLQSRAGVLAHQESTAAMEYGQQLGTRYVKEVLKPVLEL